MYYLYAEDTRTANGNRYRQLCPLRSRRFSRAMRQAEEESKLYQSKGLRFLVAEAEPEGGPRLDTAAIVGVRQKPASVGSLENQALQRRTLRRQKPSDKGREVDWDSQNEQGETLGEVVVDILRSRAKRLANSRKME